MRDTPRLGQQTEGVTFADDWPAEGQFHSLQRRLANHQLVQLRRALQCRGSGSAPEWMRAQLGISAGPEALAAPQPQAEEMPMPTNGRALPAGLQAEAERELGVGLDGVTIASGADEACDAMGALAFTTPVDGGGHTVALSSSVDLVSEDGRFTLLHELAHVAQQRRGETTALSGLAGDEAARTSLESAADAVAAHSTLLLRRGS